MKEKVKALLLFSGGLDSLLAARLLQEQNIEVHGLTIYIPYFNVQPVENAAKQIELPLKIVDISREHLAVLKNPQYGYGKNMNPCIDCHILMLKKAREIMEKEGYDFVATGEVLDERPMSQNKKALGLIEKESGLGGYLLRPLSAKLLRPTVPEEKGWIDRKELLDIVGRSRKKQMALAEKFGLEEYPTPSGGCLLTDPQFSERLKQLFDKNPDASVNDVKLLKYGRRFWGNDNLIVVGRNEADNKNILGLAQKDDIIVELENYPGPTVLVRGSKPEESIDKAAELAKYYSTKTRELEKVEVKYWKPNQRQTETIELKK
jgi:tRNA U34 2-thiouridine synthase MnmA/TrmU